MFAYCYASGLIKFGDKVPAGALPILSGPRKQVRGLIMGTARLAYDNKTWLVPGIPEASSPSKAIDALTAYTKWITPQCPTDVRTIFSSQNPIRAQDFE